MEFQCISSIAELTYMPPPIEQKDRSIQSLFQSVEVSTLQAFEKVVCGTGTELPFQKAPDSGNEYKDVLMPSRPEVIQEIPLLKASDADSLRFVEAMPSNDDERLRLQILLNRHYLNYLNAQIGLINIEYNSVIAHSKSNPYLLSTIYTTTDKPVFSEQGAESRVTGFLATLPTAAQDFRFSMDKLKLDEYPSSR